MPFFEEILDKVPAEILVADAEYRFLYANPVAVPDLACGNG
jgi:PAS domain-containing protein